MSSQKFDRSLHSNLDRESPEILEKIITKNVSRIIHENYGQHKSAIKVISKKMGINTRAVRNWYDAMNAPNCAHLVILARFIPDIVKEFLELAGRVDIWNAYQEKMYGKSKEKLEKNISNNSSNDVNNANNAPNLNANNRDGNVPASNAATELHNDFIKNKTSKNSSLEICFEQQNENLTSGINFRNPTQKNLSTENISQASSKNLSSQHLPYQKNYSFETLTQNFTELNIRQIWFLENLAKNPNLKPIDIARHWRVNRKTSKRDVSALAKAGYVKFVGATKNGKYILV
jgi:hypothetical protein